MQARRKDMGYRCVWGTTQEALYTHTHTHTLLTLTVFMQSHRDAFWHAYLEQCLSALKTVSGLAIHKPDINIITEGM